MVDLRSDTVTRPTPAMREAMANAVVGDDVFGDDPTVAALEARCAELAGKEAAMFVPSGTMANQIAIRIHTSPGDEVLLEASSHPYNYEAGGAAVIAGVQLRPIAGVDGLLDPAAVQVAIRPYDVHFAPARLLCVEDTHNRGGGTVHPLDRLDALAATAHASGVATHLDAARGFNAVVQSGVPLARRAAGFDTVSFCFSKGLGAPVGSVLCGPTSLMPTARRVRKLLGGGLRQAGILAAAALYALDHHIDRLADDHRRARELSMGLLMAGYQVKLPQTNILYVDVADASSLQARLADAGVRCVATSPTRIRLVTHLDVGDAGIARAITAFEALR
jgi:threonine aldolase